MHFGPATRLLAFALLVAASACARGPRTEVAGDGPREDPMRFDESANGSDIRLRVGEDLEIVLAENRTTGYRWEIVETGAPVCHIARDDFEAGDPAPGAPGRHTWRIGATQAGTANIALAYRRPFGSGDPARRFTLRVVVQ